MRENTLIFFVVGDNGPAAESGLDGAFNKFAKINGIAEDEETILQRIDEIGGPTSFSGYPAGWAWAGASPLQWFKQIASHLGGTRNGMVVSWPRGDADAGEIRTQFHHCVDIAPTILEAAGIPKPEIVNGVAQSKFDGISMVYSFRDARAASKRRRQYFEMIGNRAIYQDGWVAAARHGPLPWQFSGGALGEFDADRWELYNLEADFSQADDLAEKRPDRLRELQETWVMEAARNDVFPLDDRRGTRIAAGARPNPRGSQRKFSYFPGTIRVPEGLAPNVKGRSHRIRCDLRHRSGDEGVLVAAGGRCGGYVFLIQDDRLNYTYNLCGTQFYSIVSQPIADGEHVLVCDFQTDAPRLGAGGNVRLTSGAREIACGRVERTIPFRFSWTETFNVGRDSGTPVIECYSPPFAYRGDLREVTIEVLSELDEAERRHESEAVERITLENE